MWGLGGQLTLVISDALLGSVEFTVRSAMHLAAEFLTQQVKYKILWRSVCSVTGQVVRRLAVVPIAQ